MIEILLAIAPVFVLIVAGYALRRGGFPSTEFWNLNDRLVYWVLMPALFFAKISAADLSGSAVAQYGALLYTAFFAAILYAWLAGRAMPAAAASSVLQGSARFNTFVALAIAEALFAAPGLQMAILGSALLVPVVNVTVVSLITLRLGRSGRGIGRDLVRNPLILSIAAGIAVNLSGLGSLPVLSDCARILGQAALPIMLLCVGASLKLRGLEGSAVRIGAASFGKLVVFPAVAIGAMLVFPPDRLTAEVVLIFAGLPTGVASYTLARQMGGDAPLMAAIITFQTLLSFLSLPLTLVIGRAILF